MTNQKREPLSNCWNYMTVRLLIKTPLRIVCSLHLRLRPRSNLVSKIIDWWVPSRNLQLERIFICVIVENDMSIFVAQGDLNGGP